MTKILSLLAAAIALAMPFGSYAQGGGRTLKSVSISVGDSTFKAGINHKTRTVTVRGIPRSYMISGVKTEFRKGGALAAPDSITPGTEWGKQTHFTVTSRKGHTERFTVILEDYQQDHLLFYEDFSAPALDPLKWMILPRRNAEGVSIEDGNLVIKLLQIDGEFKVGGITTMTKFAMQYGRVDVRSRFVRDLSSGELPAIWMMPVPGTCKYIESNPGGGEIDIMERIKRESQIYQTCHSAYTTGEPKLNMTRHGGNCQTSSIEGTEKEYHIYGFENTPDELRFYFDGELTFTYRKMENADSLYQWPYDVPFYLNINTATGGPGRWAGPMPEDLSELPAEMHVDWVKMTANEYTGFGNYYNQKENK